MSALLAISKSNRHGRHRLAANSSSSSGQRVYRSRDAVAGNFPIVVVDGGMDLEQVNGVGPVGLVYNLANSFIGNLRMTPLGVGKWIVARRMSRSRNGVPQGE